MEGKDLQPEQAKQIHEALFPSINYLFRLRRRMEQTFLPTDELYLLVCKVYDALHQLYNELHYLSCEHGVGREEKKDPT